MVKTITYNEFVMLLLVIVKINDSKLINDMFK